MNVRLEKDLRLHLLDEEALTRININQKASRPLNTKIQYSGKQMEYFAWNAELGYPDEEVSDAKMILFLSQIKNRQPRQRGRKKTKLSCDSEVHVHGSEIIDEDQNARSVGYHLAAYTNALTDLWRMQYQLGQNPRHPIRPDAVKALLKQKKVESMREEDEQFSDRGRGTMIDCVGIDQLSKVADSFFTENSELGLKHRADNIMSFALCSRRDNMRSLKLLTIGLVECPNEGVRGAKLFRCVWRKSKKISMATSTRPQCSAKKMSCVAHLGF
ncbi:hypothetical protein AeRB84_006923 [Aphanomyces euteiches]|nr:hypothetical protein AeRB84_006923 [Aphanomyces euteiches]